MINVNAKTHSIITTRSIGKRECGLAFIEIALLLPVLLVLVLGAGYLYNYIRAYQIIRYAAETAADLASSSEIKSTSSSAVSHLIWSHQVLSGKPYRPFSFVDHRSCRKVNDVLGFTNCYGTALGEDRLFGFMWNNYVTDDSSPLGSTYNLPFPLYEQSAVTPGYSPVQLLPIIGIERGCFEPFNETGAQIAGTGRVWDGDPGSAVIGNCSHVKPMYWQSPVMADFDGDRKEDIVFFKPQGTSTTWGTRVTSSNIDFIVFYSGAGYSGTAGHGYFNLATDSSAGTPGVTPHDIPIVADYDRDGLADYAVFDPRTGAYRIAFSSSNYMVVGTGSFTVSDPTGQKGLIAIPGNFTSTSALQVAVIATGGTTAERYEIYLSGTISPTANQLNPSLGTTFTLPSGRGVSGTEVPSASMYKVMPHRGTVSVPAFGDYDDNGITEFGYLSWYGGNMARQVAGKVLGLRNSSVSSLLEATDTPSATPMDTRMNPFDIDFDVNGNLYYSDSVDGRIWRIDADGLEGVGTTATNKVSAVMPTHSTEAARTLTPDPETKFPATNVWNLVQDTRILAEGDDAPNPLPAGSRTLRTPRKLFIAKGYDDAMYIADFGNARIVRVEADAGTITSDNDSIVVLGGSECISDSCDKLDPDIPNSWGDYKGKYQIWPSAIALVPDPSNEARYFVAFSSGNIVYLITHENESGGPRGEEKDQVWRIAGQESPALAPNFSDANSSYANIKAADANSSTLCPIIDIKFSSMEPDGALYLAASCSLTSKPSESPPTSRDGGAIYKLTPIDGGDGTPSFTGGPNGLSLVVGSLWVNPCMRGVCSAPAADGSGLYQRRADISLPAKSIDLVNPVDLAIGERGEVYFINQWRSGQITNATQYPNSPNIRDNLNVQEVLVWEGPSKPLNLTSLTNPIQLGLGVSAFTSSDWKSPYNIASGDNTISTILAHPAPIKNIPFPATAGLAISGHRLYTTNPFIQNIGANGHPDYSQIEEQGTIYSVDLDMDGDGTDDLTDTDIDGDGVLNTAEGSNRSAFCPEIWGTTANQACRPQEKVGVPRQTFFRLTGGNLSLQGEGTDTETGAPAGKTYGEYLLFNSVTECNDSVSCAGEGYISADARSETWATLFNWGDDYDRGVTDACTSANSNDPTSAYSHCIESANGPIAAPLPLHAFVGWHSIVGDSSFRSYPGAHFLANSSPTSANKSIDPGLFLFPTILSSTTPKENGIKPTRRVSIDSSKSPRITKSGVLCRDYKAQKYNTIAEPNNAASAFKFNFNSYLSNYFYTGYLSTWNSTSNNDLYNYMPSCNLSTGTFPVADGREPAIEGIILQLDHDETTEKEAGTGAPHWPNQWVTGVPTDPENSRILTFLDLDGNGTRDPTFLLPPAAAGAIEISDGVMANPYLLIGTGLKNSSATYDTSTINYIDKFRYPLSRSDFIDGTFMLDLSNDVIAPPYLRLDNSFDESSNFTFDVGRAGEDFKRDNTLFLSLDFEPFFGRKLQIANRQDAGAGLYTNYSRSTRFRDTVSGVKPPPITAAKNILKLGLGLSDSDIVATSATPLNGQATIGYLENGSECTGTITGTARKNCDSVQITYTTTYFGNTINISVTQPLNQGFIGRHTEKCDPDAAVAGFGCS